MGASPTPAHLVTDADVARAVLDAMAAREPVRVVGSGTWLDAGGARPTARTILLGHARGVVEHTPGDLTITVRAGTTLAEIDSALRPHHQWLPLDPVGSPDVTIGATAATCSYGPLAELYGTPRDQVLGLTVVTGRGEVLHTGGRVVKNVAGFDLTRLMIGAWGTLGIITQVTLRVRARGINTHAPHTFAPPSFEHMGRAMPTRYGYRAPVVTHPALSGAIKRLFDPYGILNPGIMEQVE